MPSTTALKANADLRLIIDRGEGGCPLNDYGPFIGTQPLRCQGLIRTDALERVSGLFARGSSHSVCNAFDDHLLLGDMRDLGPCLVLMDDLDGLDAPTPPPEKPGRRTHQVKVTLNAAELQALDTLVASSGTDRASVFRALLTQAAVNGLAVAGGATSLRTDESNLAVDQKPFIYIAEPTKFTEMAICIDAMKQGNVVNLNLTMQEPELAQRSVDFVAGGCYSLGGHQERIGESIFLFAPKNYQVDRRPPDDVIKASVSEVERRLDENSPANPPLLKAENKKNSEADSGCESVQGPS